MKEVGNRRGESENEVSIIRTGKPREAERAEL